MEYARLFSNRNRYGEKRHVSFKYKVVAFLIALYILPLGIGKNIAFSEGNINTASSVLKIDGNCDFEKKEKAFAILLLSHPEQKHDTLTCNPVLQWFAESRAQDMAMKHYYSHVGPDNVGPNEELEMLGYILPDSYRHGRSNSIESIAGGYPTADSAFNALLDSTPHRKHLLGLNSIYLQQNEFGIGYSYNPETSHKHFWVIIIARNKTAEDPDLVCAPPPGACYEVIR